MKAIEDGSGSEALHADRLPIDAVRVRISPPIAKDFETRCVFTAMLGGKRGVRIANSVAYWLSASETQGVMADARTRRQGELSKGLATAYTCLINQLGGEVQQAMNRAKQASLFEPIHSYSFACSEKWKGTREQFVRWGLEVKNGFPGDQGVPNTKVIVRDKRGYSGSLTVSLEHPEIFELELQVPEEVSRAARLAEKEARAESEKAKRQAIIEKYEVKRLKDMPQSKQAFRDSVSKSFRLFAEIVMDKMQEEGGYRYTKDEIDEFLQTAKVLYWRLKQGDVEGAHPSKSLEKVMARRAKADLPLQDFLREVKGAAS
jgi:hypothetical protein